jgi:hypothetical protein
VARIPPPEKPARAGMAGPEKGAWHQKSLRFMRLLASRGCAGSAFFFEFLAKFLKKSCKIKDIVLYYD